MHTGRRGAVGKLAVTTRHASRGRDATLHPLMDMTQERPPSYRTSSARKGPLGLVAEAIREVRDRRRLIRYLAQADLKKKGTDTFFGNVWWVLDPPVSYTHLPLPTNREVS